MNQWSIKTFLTLAEVKRMSVCAQLMCVTKSTVSSRIRQLELELDQALFSRSVHGMTLTAAGKRFYQHAQVMQQRWEFAKSDVKLSSESSVSLSIATHSTLALAFLQPWGSLIRQHSTDVTLRLSAYYSTEIIAKIAQGSIDIGLIFLPDISEGVLVEQVYEDELIMVADQPMHIDEINSSNYLYIDWGWGYNAAHNERLVQLQHSLQSAELGEIGLPWLLSSGGAAYLPTREAQPSLNSKALFMVEDAPVFKRPIYVAFAREPQNKRLVESSIELLKEFMQNID